MPFVGAHLSIAGGYYKAAESAARYGMDCVQIFTKNNNQWRAKPLSEEEIVRFRGAVRERGLSAACAHTSYLINLASPDDELWLKSLESFVIELQRAHALGLAGVVVHPGSYVLSSEESGLRRIVMALNEAARRTQDAPIEVWLETTAGQGSSLGWRFEHLQFLIESCAVPQRIGVCVDTCHLFAAGYPLRTKREYEETVRQLDTTIGLARVRALHLNDSKKPLGSRVDRHAHIGEGCIGLEPFRRILRDERLAHLPMYLETPKGERDGQDLDAMNLATLRRLMKRRGVSTRTSRTRLKGAR